MDAVSPSRNAEYVKETVFALRVRIKVVCNSIFMILLYIEMLLWQFKKWAWCLLPEMAVYVEETVIAGLKLPVIVIL